MKYLVIIGLLAIASARYIPRQESYDIAALSKCYHNECKEIYNMFSRDCHTNPNRTEGYKTYLHCSCEALQDISDDCRTCMNNAGRNVTLLTENVCKNVDGSIPISTATSLATKTMSTPVLTTASDTKLPTVSNLP